MKRYPKYLVLVEHKKDLWSFIEINAKDYNDALTKALGKGLLAHKDKGFYLVSKVRKLPNGLCRYKEVIWVCLEAIQSGVVDPYDYDDIDIDIDSIDFEDESQTKGEHIMKLATRKWQVVIKGTKETPFYYGFKTKKEAEAMCERLTTATKIEHEVIKA